MTGRHGLVILLLATAMLVVLLAAVERNYFSVSSGAISSEAFIQELRGCLTDREAVIKCAPEIIRKQMEGHTASETMKVLSDSFSTRDCHVMGHTVGQTAYKKTGSVEKAISDCGLTCGSACIHGAIGQAFIQESGINTDTIDLQHLSADEVRTYGKALCKTVDTCHGVGHILFQLYNEIDTPLATCTDITEGIKRQSCFTGLFMENADMVSTHNLLLETRKKQVRDVTDLAYPCNAVPREARHACLRYQFRVQKEIFEETGITDIKKQYQIRKQVCESFEGAQDRTDCFEGLGFSAYMLIHDDPSRAHRYCNNFSQTTDRAACMLGMTFWATNFGQIQESLSFCEGVAAEYERNICYHGVFEIVIAEGEPPKTAGRYCEKQDKASLCMSGYEAYLANPWSQLFGLPIKS